LIQLRHYNTNDTVQNDASFYFLSIVVSGMHTGMIKAFQLLFIFSVYIAISLWTKLKQWHHMRTGRMLQKFEIITAKKEEK